MDAFPLVVDRCTPIVPDQEVIESNLIGRGEEGDVLLLHLQLRTIDLMTLLLLLAMLIDLGEMGFVIVR